MVSAFRVEEADENDSKDSDEEEEAEERSVCECFFFLL